jgi:hypothetical protein
MSLINDALKRAREAERQRSSPSDHTPLQPADNPYRPGPVARWLILCLVAIVLLFSGLSFWKWARQTDTAPRALITPSIPNESPLTSQLPQLPNNPAAIVAFSNAPQDPTSNTNTSPVPNPVSESPLPDSPPIGTSVPPVPLEFQVTPELPPPTTVTEPEPAPEPIGPPDFRLQSIIFRVQKPAALINGEMLHVGDFVGEARVNDIQRDAVTITWRDTNLVLRLPRF